MTDDLDSDRTEPSPYVDPDDTPELEISDEDILESMVEIPGYLDVSTEDFRLLYHLAHRHALARVFKNIRADRLMRTGVVPLHPQMMLDEAAAIMSRQRVKGLPVATPDNRVVGILTETDYLHWLQTDSVMTLMLNISDATDLFARRGNKTAVQTIMTADVATLAEDDGFREIVSAFHTHEGGAMPVVNATGHLVGMLMRVDFLKACHLEGLL
jgi:CBS domain-containing membrane protein